MKKLSFCYLTALALALSQSADAALLLYYNFETGQVTNNSLIDNIVAGPDGTLRFGTAGGTVAFSPGGTVSGGNLGQSLTLTPAAIGNSNLEAPHIDTNFTATALGITPSTDYTAMAWIKFADISATSGDNMIFGQNNTPIPPDTNGRPVLHHGSRNTDYHSGHWADDHTPATPDAQVGVWHHVAYTNNAAGVQEIFVDGASIGSSGVGTAGGMVTALNVLIGTSGNGGSLTGQLDEVKVYNELLSAAQIQQASQVIPEPSTVAALIGGFGVLLALRRRRQ